MRLDLLRGRAELANLIALTALPPDRCPRRVVWSLSDTLRYHRLGESQKARRHADQALAIAREVGYGLLVERAAVVLNDVTAPV